MAELPRQGSVVVTALTTQRYATKTTNDGPAAGGVRVEGAAVVWTGPDDFLSVAEFRTIHRYPKDPRYRRSGVQSEPQVGDIALCGWVKEIPNDPSAVLYRATCLACLRLSELAS